MLTHLCSPLYESQVKGKMSRFPKTVSLIEHWQPLGVEEPLWVPPKEAFLYSQYWWPRGHIWGICKVTIQLSFFKPSDVSRMGPGSCGVGEENLAAHSLLSSILHQGRSIYPTTRGEAASCRHQPLSPLLLDLLLAGWVHLAR